MSRYYLAEIFLPSLAAVAMLIYHLHYYYLVKQVPMQTAIGITRYLRGLWVETVMEQKRDILAVQTLRNWIMASSFLASTAIIISLGILGYIFQHKTISELPFSFDRIVSNIENIDILKILVLFMVFAFAFFNFTLSIRYYNHVNFMINVPLDRDEMVRRRVCHQNLKFRHDSLYLGHARLLSLWTFFPLAFRTRLDVFGKHCGPDCFI